MFCPNCGYEYRNDFSICPDCQVSLEDNIPDNKKYYNENKIRLYKSKSAIKNAIKKVLNSNIYIKLSLVCYNLFIIALFLFSYFTLRFNSLLLMGPGWEIPVDLVRPIELSQSFVKISFWLCIFLFIIAYKRFNKQRPFAKALTILWFVANIILSIYFINDLQENHKILVINYWWVGLILPGILIPILIYNNLKLNRKNNEEYTSKIHVLIKNKYFLKLSDHIQKLQRYARTKYILEYFKNNYNKILCYLLIVITSIAYHPMASDYFWKYLLKIENSNLIFIIDIFVNFIFLMSILWFESKFKLKCRFARITRNIPEHRMGTVSFVILLISIAFLFGAIFLGGYLTNDVVLGYLLSYVGVAIFYYTLYIVGG